MVRIFKEKINDIPHTNRAVSSFFAQDAALRICGQLTDNLKTLSDKDAGFENVHRGALNLAKIVGEMSDSAAKDKEKNTTEIQSHVPVSN